MFKLIWLVLTDPETFKAAAAWIWSKTPTLKQTGAIVVAVAAWLVHSGVLAPWAGTAGWAGGIVAMIVAIVAITGEKNHTPEEITAIVSQALDAGKIQVPAAVEKPAGGTA